MRNSYKTHKVKEYNVINFIRITHRGSLPKSCKSLSLLIPMHLTYLSNITKGNDFVNKSTRLSQDFVCKMLISHALVAHTGKTISEKYVSYN
jgi:hypothetical protein